MRVTWKRGGPLPRLTVEGWGRSKQPTPPGFWDFNHAGRCLLWTFLACCSYRMRYTKNKSLIIVAVTYTCEHRGPRLISSQMYAENDLVWRLNHLKHITTVERKLILLAELRKSKVNKDENVETEKAHVWLIVCDGEHLHLLSFFPWSCSSLGGWPSSVSAVARALSWCDTPGQIHSGSC